MIYVALIDWLIDWWSMLHWWSMFRKDRKDQNALFFGLSDDPGVGTCYWTAGCCSPHCRPRHCSSGTILPAPVSGHSNSWSSRHCTCLAIVQYLQHTSSFQCTLPLPQMPSARVQSMAQHVGRGAMTWIQRRRIIVTIKKQKKTANHSLKLNDRIQDTASFHSSSLLSPSQPSSPLLECLENQQGENLIIEEQLNLQIAP